MKVSFTVVTYDYKAGRGAKELIDSALLDSDLHDIDFRLFLHSNDKDTRKMCRWLEDQRPVRLYPYGYNRGLSVSWNEGMIAGWESSADVVVITNDDVIFSAGDVDKLVKKAIGHRENYMVSVAGQHGMHKRWERSHGYSCFALNPISHEEIGCFDENLFPAYFEDVDHHRRATLLGLVEENCHDTQIFHQGSGTINANELVSISNLATQRKNGLYYREKWGGVNGEEIFVMPFRNSNFGLRIPSESRHAPYPGFNRTDYKALVGVERTETT